MLNITIQNDGKIKFQSECSSTKEMRHNVNLLLAVVSSMEMEEAVAKKEANGIEVEYSKNASAAAKAAAKYAYKKSKGYCRHSC